MKQICVHLRAAQDMLVLGVTRIVRWTGSRNVVYVFKGCVSKNGMRCEKAA